MHADLPQAADPEPAAPAPAQVLPVAAAHCSWEERLARARAVGERALLLVRGQDAGEPVPELAGIPRPRYFVLVRDSRGTLYQPLRIYTRITELRAQLARHQSGGGEPLHYEFASQKEVEAFGRAIGWRVAFNSFQ